MFHYTTTNVEFGVLGGSSRVESVGGTVYAGWRQQDSGFVINAGVSLAGARTNGSRAITLAGFTQSLAGSTTGTTTTNDALAYLQSLQSPAASDAQRDASASLLPLLGSPLSSRSPSLRASRMASRSSASSSRWHRFSLAPGVELHLSESASIPPPGTRREAWLRRLIDRLREQLDPTD